MKTPISIIVLLAVTTLLAVGDERKSTNGVEKQITKTVGMDKPAMTDEQRLLAAIPELQWNQDRFVSEGWMKPGQIVMPKANNFSKKDSVRFGLTGEISFLFTDQRLLDCSFYIVDGEAGTTIGNEDWNSLYKAVKAICTSPEKRTGDAKSSAVSWTVMGEVNEYDVKLTRRVFGTTIERGLEILIKPVKK